MSDPVGWTSPARRDAARAHEIGTVAASVDGVAAVSPAGRPTAPAAVPRPDIAVFDDRVELHLVADYGRSLPEVADRLATTLIPLLDGRELRVIVDDILLPGEVLSLRVQSVGTPPAAPDDTDAARP